MAVTPETPEKEYCSTSEAAQRLGLSLGTVQQMVENGQLEGWKTAGGHRRIRVSSIEEFRARSMAGNSVNQPRPAANSLQVLVAEDDRITRLAVRRLLEKEGHAVAEAVDGVQALEALLRAPFDLVLMDIQMPVLDGVQAVRAMRGDPRYAVVAGLPVVALTAYAMAGDRETFLAAGMDAYVPKPVFRDELRRAMEDALAAAQARTA